MNSNWRCNRLQRQQEAVAQSGANTFFDQKGEFDKANAHIGTHKRGGFPHHKSNPKAACTYRETPVKEI